MHPQHLGNNNSNVGLPQKKKGKRIRVAVGDSWEGLNAHIDKTKLHVFQGVSIVAGASFLVFMAYAITTRNDHMLDKCWSLVVYTCMGVAAYAMSKGSGRGRK